MHKILTIDWDYFISVPLSVRDNDYPRVTSGNLGDKPDNRLWLDVDQSSSDFFMEEYTQLLEWIARRSICGASRTNHLHAFLSENHGFMYDIATGGEKPDAIYNVDFHHDVYFSGSKVNCSNWLALVQQKYPDMKSFWCSRPDSYTDTFGQRAPVEDFPFAFLQDLVLEADVIHLCRSDLYSPPKFDHYFWGLWETIAKVSDLVDELETLEDRRRYAT